ncbi:archaellin/type IV pilin N-terminal domain-containing protein [Haloglomus halophilum]|uniref:archaellin/type IV pilin N-terminal domain-containing protein n=1 Tax=Haloglomus halophilum TaxID=2962672 RepID=UPI0020C973F3|nr:archaellin/type IV pilin N-terminal domain-containing protein [Haloglomus halophilum]
MFETINNSDEERGQVGIGTLIVFIALVLVAAIAAGVLINTAGFLQNQAESTGQESSDQVTNGVNVVSASGISDDANDTVDRFTITVSQSPGADPIDLTDAKFEYLDESATTVDSTDADVSLNAVKGGSTTLTQSSDRVEITVKLQNGPGSIPVGGLDPGDEAEFKIITKSGATTTEVLNVPDPIGDDNAVVL